VMKFLPTAVAFVFDLEVSRKDFACPTRGAF